MSVAPRLRAAAIAAALLPCAAAAQGSPIGRGLDLEQRGRLREAAVAFREAIAELPAPAMLGYERVMMELGQVDTLLAVVDSAIRARPGDATFRTVQLRALHSAGRRSAERLAFDRWLADAPRGDATPYREYARLLLNSGESASADSILERARHSVNDTREFSVELAQIRASLGRWNDATHSWREIVERVPFLEQAALFSLSRADTAGRPRIRIVLAGAPVSVAARRLLAQLELQWGSPSAAWTAVSSLPPDSQSVRAWREIGERAEQLEAWAVARDAFGAVTRAQFSVPIALRAAVAALEAGDPTAAMTLAQLAGSRLDSSAAAGLVAPVHVRALADLGRAPDADRVARAFERWLDDAARDRLRRMVAWAWIRVGDIGRARALLATLAPTEESDEIAAWLALYEGDLGRARSGFKSTRATTTETVRAMALLSRTKADSAPALGRAFLALARRDTVRAAHELEMAASALPEAASALLLAAGRLRLSSRDTGPAERTLARVATEFEASPEAPEAEFEWARSLARRGETGAAIGRLEHLILSYPTSALVPQARRELDALRGRRAPERT